MSGQVLRGPWAPAPVEAPDPRWTACDPIGLPAAEVAPFGEEEGVEACLRYVEANRGPLEGALASALATGHDRADFVLMMEPDAGAIAAVSRRALLAGFPNDEALDAELDQPIADGSLRVLVAFFDGADWFGTFTPGATS